MVDFIGPPAGATRNRPICEELRAVLAAAAEEVGVDLVRITSGGQPGTHGRRTGSTRHDGGRAADLQLCVGGVTKTFTDRRGGPVVEGFVKAAASFGATGIGAGVGYMGNRTLHVGFGRTPSDTSRLVWGEDFTGATAPAWLRMAAEAGWAAARPAPEIAPPSEDLPARFKVAARSGLKLRLGPALDFGVVEVMPADREVTVLGFDGPGADWARIDLEDDGQVDGHAFAAFLRRVDTVSGGRFEDREEPA